MQLVAAPLPQSPLVRRRAPPVTAAFPAASDNSSDDRAPPTAGDEDNRSPPSTAGIPAEVHRCNTIALSTLAVEHGEIRVGSASDYDSFEGKGTQLLPIVPPEATIVSLLPVEGPTPGDTVEQPQKPTDPDELERRAYEIRAAVYSRLLRDGRWSRLDLGGVRDDMMREAKKRMSVVEAKIWTYSELDRLYQPDPRFTTSGSDEVAGVSSTANAADGDQVADGEPPSRVRESESSELAVPVTERVTPSQQLAPESSRLQGLGDVPATWLPLPANASLAAEIGWVQANRLYVVEERGNTTIVHLDRAHEPAPSRAAIGWLETSIRSYAKYVDVVGKYLGVESDEASVVRRERLAIAEIRSLLDEMHVD